ncbi:hypothetical protein RFI_37655, partial [Reticulomyxa filosa]
MPQPQTVPTTSSSPYVDKENRATTDDNTGKEKEIEITILDTKKASEMNQNKCLKEDSQQIPDKVSLFCVCVCFHSMAITVCLLFCSKKKKCAQTCNHKIEEQKQMASNEMIEEEKRAKQIQ